MKNYTRKELESMTDQELLSAYLTQTSPGFRDHRSETEMLRNGRWGTCVDCPHDTLGVHPENCKHTERYDHNIHHTRDGKFFEYNKEIPKSALINALLL